MTAEATIQRGQEKQTEVRTAKPRPVKAGLPHIRCQIVRASAGRNRAGGAWCGSMRAADAVKVVAMSGC